MNLRLPLRDIQVNQPFGANYLDFYQKWGLKGHNGVDFRAMDGCPCYASHVGTVTWAGIDGDGGLSVNLASQLSGDGYYTIYYHLKDVVVKVGDHIMAGQLIGHCDNTGKYTTGDHLHFGLKQTFNGATINKDNGYAGAIDPTPYFFANYIGQPISNRDCYKSASYLRYFRTDRNLKSEISMAGTLFKVFKRLPRNEEINAAVYGSWDREALTNPAMAWLWMYRTKSDITNGNYPFK